VAEVAVFGVPDDRLGEEVAAAVVAADGATVDQDALVEFLVPRLARHKIPKYIYILDTPLPRNANGKFMKRELRQALTGDHQ
ncbi:MAG TPA: AMP-dependent synthetase, partial [Ilumatobacteraceae bacterium]|nr:AMP-dependent synthetase [Ilumatobacteraceae bacterium]